MAKKNQKSSEKETRGRPRKSPKGREAMSVRIDADVLEAVRQGAGQGKLGDWLSNELRKIAVRRGWL